MKNKFLVLAIIPLFCFASCSNNGNSSSSTSDKSTSQTSEETSSQTSEESSQESISESSEESSDTSISPAPEKLISLFNKDSVLYINSLTNDSNATLKTYHHKDFDDVPFIDFEEFHYGIRPYIEKSRSFSQIDEDNYVYSTFIGEGKMYFDAKNDTIKCVNFNAFLDAIGVNNNISGDITSNHIALYQSSEKTAYINKGKDVEINLKDYGMDMVSQNNRLYVSISIANSVILPSYIAGITYNGKDFFITSCLARTDISVYARSGNYNFSWPLANSECPTAFKKVANKLDNEAYRFEGIFADRDDRDDMVTMSLFKDGSGTVNGSGACMVHRAVKWRLDNDVLKLITGQTPYESSDLDDVFGPLSDVWINTKDTLYAKKVRSDKMSEETYHDLCLSSDLNYGLKKEKNIKTFDQFFTEKNLKEKLLSNDIMVYEDAVVEFICKHIDDIHSAMGGGESVYSASETKAFIRVKSFAYNGPRYTSYYQEVSELGGMKGGVSPYEVVGKTAFLRFQRFAHNSASCFPINHKDYQTENHEEAKKAFQSAVGDNPYKAFAIAFNDLSKMNDVKNVVIDMTCNIGGEIRCMPYLVAFMTLDPSIVVENQIDGSLIDFHYKVDLNGDGVFGGSGDSFAGKYNFYLLNGANFSAGNELPTIAKNTGFAKNIGRKSAGGSCAVANRCDISGLTYRMSSSYRLMEKEGDKYISNDAGISPDLTIPFDNMFDTEKMDKWLSSL